MILMENDIKNNIKLHDVHDDRKTLINAKSIIERNKRTSY